MFKEILTEAITDKIVTKAFTPIIKDYQWGNYRFQMDDFEMSTSGGEDDDYNDEDDSAEMTVYADNKESFTFLYKGDTFSIVNVKDKKTAKTILDNLASGNFKEAND